MIVVDTTILVYAVGGEHPLRDPSRRLVEAITKGRVDGRTTAEAIQAFAHVRARRRGRQDAARLARRYADLLAPLLAVERAELANGLRLFEQHPELGSFDAVLAAVAVNCDADALVSGDRGFRSVPGLRYVDPGTPELENLLPA